MKLAWNGKAPVSGNVPMRGGDATSTPQLRMNETTVPTATKTSTKQKDTAAAGKAVTGFIKDLGKRIGEFFQATPATPAARTQPFVLPEQAQLKKQAENYAESPFEKSLFEKALNSANRKSSTAISKIWAQGITSNNTETREAALALMRSFIAHSAGEHNGELSAHTQMKLMLFSPHLSEGPIGKALLYQAVFNLPLENIIAFANFFKKDFSTLPALQQALLMKQLLDRRRELKLDKKEELTEDEIALKKLVKSLVIKFYGENAEPEDELLANNEKIRVGFLKMHPIEDAYREQLEESEKKYRLKLRQLKKRRSQNVAQAEEERVRRIEMVYDTVESQLIAGLSELEVPMDTPLPEVKAS